MAFKPEWPEELQRFIAGALHVHDDTELPEQACQGEENTLQNSLFAAASGLEWMVVTPHTINPSPGKPRHFSATEPLGSALLDYIEKTQQMEVQGALPVHVYAGLEDNQLEDGPCAPDEILNAADFVITSIHGAVPRSAQEVLDRFAIACQNPYVDMIGHMGRYLEDVPDIDWGSIFAGLVASNKFAEANFNATQSYGPPKLSRKAKSLSDWRYVHHVAEIQREFYAEMGRSGVKVLVSLDIHNAGMWPSATPSADWMPTVKDLYSYLGMIIDAGVSESQIVNHSVPEYIANRRSRLAA